MPGGLPCTARSFLVLVNYIQGKKLSFRDYGDINHCQFIGIRWFTVFYAVLGSRGAGTINYDIKGIGHRHNIGNLFRMGF